MGTAMGQEPAGLGDSLPPPIRGAVPARTACRYVLDWMPRHTHGHNGRPFKTNRWPTVCHSCGDRLEPGEAMVGSFEDGHIQWVCGAGRWRRP